MDDNREILNVEELKSATDMALKVLEQLDRMLLGRHQLHLMVLVGVLSRGHILLEGVPGLGKTQLVKAVSEVLQLQFKRIQFTPDLMPADILGGHILQEGNDGKRELVFRPGPVFTNILLADEINRASPKTQSALLETMQETSVTLLGTTWKLPEPFFVLASQNPIELEGTYPLPEAQVDRFMFRLFVRNVGPDVLQEIIETRRRGKPPSATWSMKREELNDLFKIMDRIILPKPVAKYISRLVAATHPDYSESTDMVHNYMLYGASPRASIAIAEAARAHALLECRPTVGFKDVKMVAEPVLNHRLILNYKAKFDKIDTVQVVADLLGRLDETEIKVPEDMKIELTEEG